MSRSPDSKRFSQNFPYCQLKLTLNISELVFHTSCQYDLLGLHRFSRTICSFETSTSLVKLDYLLLDELACVRVSRNELLLSLCPPFMRTFSFVTRDGMESDCILVSVETRVVDRNGTLGPGKRESC